VTDYLSDGYNTMPLSRPIIKPGGFRKQNGTFISTAIEEMPYVLVLSIRL
jgi:hypothetical protein